MATVTEMRAWLRANTGEDIPARGRLDARLIQMYEAAHDDQPSGDPDWDLDGADPLDGPEDLEPSVPLQPERPPRTARAARAERRAQPVGQRTSRLLGALRGDQDTGKKPGGKKKPPPRTSVEKLTTRLYGTLGRMMQTLSPATGNCLQAQAAMAGVIMEDTVRGTVVDRIILQPAARAEDKLDKVAALVLPPVLCFAIEQNQAAVQLGAKTPQQGMMRHAMLLPVLRESLRLGLEVSEAYADQIKARLERNAEQEAEIDKLIAMIFGQAQATAEDVTEPEMAGAAA